LGIGLWLTTASEKQERRPKPLRLREALRGRQGVPLPLLLFLQGAHQVSAVSFPATHSLKSISDYTLGVEIVPSILAFANVSKHYRHPSGEVLKALDEVSFSIAPGKKLAITGRSGSGKSTLLHLAAAIDVPSAGKVELLGRDVSRLSDRERTLLRRDAIGLVFQFFYLLPHLTVWENVVLPAWIASDSNSDERAKRLLDRVGLAGQREQEASKLSGGEMQRVAICRALLRKPKLLLADEPTGNLDDENSGKVMDLLMNLVDEEDGTLLYVTHSQEQAAQADEQLRLHGGKLEPA
jgi:putative ABC transport system ATP-binding protein